jgi:hypothetical protein
MSLTYAGYPLALLTEEYEDFLEHYHSLTDFRVQDVWGFDAYGIEYLPLPSIPLKEETKIGELVWPNGMVRCAYAHYLVDSTNLTLIQTALGTGGGPANLVMTDGNGNSLTFSLYYLCANPLSQIDGQTQCYLLTLVDSRYNLRTKTGSVTSTPVSWTNLFSTLSSVLGITLTVDSISSSYANPTSRWVVYEKPLSVLLEAACNAVGHRIVANLDGTFNTQSYTTASNALNSQTADLIQTAGGLLLASDLPRPVPATVKTVFPQSTPAPFTVTNTLVSLALSGYGSATGVAGQVATVNAELTYTGSNITACDNYAQQAATDYYNWNLIDVDASYPGVLEWTPTAAEDRIYWKYCIDKILTRILRGVFQYLPTGGYESISTSPPPPISGTPNTTPAYDSAGTGLQDTSQYVIDAPSNTSFLVKQYLVPVIGNDPLTSPTQYTVVNGDYNGTGAPQIIQYVVTNGITGGSGYSQTVTALNTGIAQYVVDNYNLQGVQGYSGQTVSGGLFQYVIGGNSTLTQGYVLEPTLSSGNITQFTLDPTLWNGSSAVSAPIQYTVSGSQMTETYPSNMTLDLSAATVILPPSSSPSWIKITKTYTDFSIAASNNTITIYTLPAGGVIIATKVKHSVVFSGGSIAAYLLDGIGVGGNTGKFYGTGFNMTQPVFPTTGLVSSSLAPTNAALLIESQTTTSAITASVSVTGSGALLNQATQGSVDIWLLVSIAI